MRNEPENCKSIEDVRFEIDAIDFQLIGLIAQRGNYVRPQPNLKPIRIRLRLKTELQQ